MKFWIVALALTAPTPSLSTWFSSTCAADNGFLSPALRIGLKKEPALLVCDSGHTASQQQRCGCARSRVRLITGVVARVKREIDEPGLEIVDQVADVVPRRRR